MAYLVGNPSGSARVDGKLKEANHIWLAMKDHYLSIEKEQIPVIVLVTTNKILKQMTEAGQLYAEAKDASPAKVKR